MFTASLRTRFAPSPTGFLHIGGLRTALFTWILAKQQKGIFILRIEDTDQARSMPGAVENILETLHWAGLSPDEGVVLDRGVPAEKGGKGPYFQSERLDLYKKHAEELIEKGHAYRCFCTPQRLEQMRLKQQALKQAPMYDRHCLDLAPEEVAAKLKEEAPSVIRLRVPRERTILFDDAVRGEVSFKGHTIDDQVLLKSDGFPTYHLANVVDDHHMGIDLVLRGEEWLSSTPKHILLFEAFGWLPPQYAHVPLLLNKDKSKLSKRQGDAAAEDYIKKGYLKEALLNFLALLGWNPGTEQEIFSLEELVEQFSLERIQKGGAVFDVEKLDWLQGQWMRKMDPKDFAKRIQPIVGEKYPAAQKDKDFGKKAALVQERILFFSEAAHLMHFFYETPHVTLDVLANEKQKVTKDKLPTLLEEDRKILEGISDKKWTAETLLAAFKERAGKGDLKLGQLLWPLRASLTGLPYSPGAVEVAEILGKEETLKRLEKAKKIV
ncbi:glutamate--tRNA ligase [Candidatus Peregrinibacteria bacterium]|nr:glutamate--tRNA ligase [Candidatus Peregrinibacteria bacterium]